MQSKKQKKIKYNVVKVVAFMTAICYIFGPAHVQIGNILHTISHNLKAPSYVIQHDQVDNIKFYEHVSYKYAASSYELDHQHEVIDFLDKIFDSASNDGDNHQGESSVFEIKINEHIGSEKYMFPLKNTEYQISHLFWETFRYSHGGFLEQLLRPPRV